MKKILFTLLAMSLVAGAMAQQKKCGIDTRALVRDEIAAGATHIGMLAKMAPDFDRGVFEKAGIRFGAQAGQIVTMTVPVEALPLLDSEKSVLQYSISHRIAEPTCDYTRYDTRTDSVQKGLGVDRDTSFNGEGVYIGITDWGFDYTHPNYNNSGANNLRIEMAWDHFRKAGPAPAGFDYGTLLVGHKALKAAECDTSNLYGYGTHGTHVAGIAAGRGLNGRNTGQAPFAKLLLCSFGLGEKEWMDGVAWMHQVAQDSARRLVVNSSWGMYSFSTLDGTSLLSQAIDAWSDEGTVFCTSGGNNGNSEFHISGTFEAGNADTLKTVASWFTSSQGVGQVLIMWGEAGHDFQAGFGMKRSGEVTAIPFINTALGDTIIVDTLMVGETPIAYRALVEHANPFDNRPHIQLEVSRNNDMQLQLYITATDGTVHAWNVANKQNHAGNEGCSFSNGSTPGFTAGDNEYGVGEPACATKAISVAAHLADYPSEDSTSSTPHGLAGFSSHGPLISGVQKPEISAPGVDVISSISYYTTDSYGIMMYKWVLDKKYTWSQMSGTSMSSPAVTGIVALMLQANPALTVDEIRNIIFTTARNDAMTGSIHATGAPHTRWGWGKIDALRAVNMALSTVSIVQVETLRTPLKVFPNPATQQVTVRTNCGERQTLSIYAIDGRLVKQVAVDQEVTLNVSGWAKGVYLVRVGSRTEKLIVR